MSWLPVFKKEDSWANLIGLSLVLLIVLVYSFGNFDVFDLFRVKFSSFQGFDFVQSFYPNPWQFLGKILTLFVFFALIFYITAHFLGKQKGFLLNFSILFLLSLLVFILGVSAFAKTWQLETPLIALIIGLILSNLTPLNESFRNSLLTEFYVKIGIVLMGATLPLNLLLSAGSVAIVQACIITIITFFSIFYFATRLFKLDPSFAATLGAGGSICGVSAAIVIGNASHAKKEHISVAISIVVFWAVIMVIALPFVCRALGLDMGVAGAFIGTSEFADAAGLAAAQALGDERAVAAFTLIKVIGRDMFIGVWAVLVAFLATFVWSKTSQKDDINAAKSSKLSIIWQRFPKFILGFSLASVIGTLFLAFLPESAAKPFQKEALGFIKELRNWVFTFTFLCIGLSTRFSEIIKVGYKPFVTFTLGVLINLPLGFVLSQFVFVDFWTNFNKE